MQPAVSVIMPVWNAEASLRRSVQSVLEQTLQDWELLLIDDGSTDGTAAIMAEMQTQDVRIRILRQENQGPGPARNRGMDEARGRFCFFLDADDVLAEPKTLERLYACSAKNNVQICGGGLEMEEAGQRRPAWERKMRFEQEGLARYQAWQYDYGYVRFLYSLDLLRKARVRFPRLRRYQDPPFFVRAMTAAEKFYALTETTYVCHRHEVSWNIQKTLDLLTGIADVARFAKSRGQYTLLRQQVLRMFVEYKGVILKALFSDNRWKVAERLLQTLSLFQQRILDFKDGAKRLYEYFGLTSQDVAVMTQAAHAFQRVTLSRGTVVCAKVSGRL